MDEYIKQIRQKMGKDKFIHPAARILIENNSGEILIIKRCDNGKIGIPAGGIEFNETIEECIKREVKEETGLIINKLEVIGISTNPNSESVTYPNGDQIQYFTIEFYSSDFVGELRKVETEEIQEVKFVKRNELEELPENERSTLKSLDFYKSNGKVMLK